MTDASGTIGIRPVTRRPLNGRVQPAQGSPPTVRRANLFVVLCALAGVVLPSEVQFSLADGARFTSGRLAAALLFFPALFVLLQKGRRFISCDFLAFSTAVWMVAASLISGGTSSLPAAGGEALDFLGGYLIARAFVFGRPALDTFARVLSVFAFIVIILAMADSFSGRLIVHETIGAIVNTSQLPAAGQRNGMVRAASTFDHEILFGVLLRRDSSNIALLGEEFTAAEFGCWLLFVGVHIVPFVGRLDGLCNSPCCFQLRSVDETVSLAMGCPLDGHRCGGLCIFYPITEPIGLGSFPPDPGSPDRMVSHDDLGGVVVLYRSISDNGICLSIAQ